MTTDHLTEDQLAALDVARTTAVALHARVAAGSDDDAARALIRTAGAAVDALVVAIPALADTHAGWMGRWGATTRQPADRRALAVVDHLAALTDLASQPVIPVHPGSRFAGDLDEVVITRP